MLSYLPHFPNFNPRSREGSDSSVAKIVVSSDGFQSTLPRRERPGAGEITSRKATISIHAPAKGATDIRIPKGYYLDISIHAPAKGATWQEHKEEIKDAIFQSTLPRRERRSPKRKRPSGPRFQSTLPRRERRKWGTVHDKGTEFQSTLPRRERHRPVDVESRSRTISIHAPAKGATSLISVVSADVSVFQSTLPRRERPYTNTDSTNDFQFQSTLPRRERRVQNKHDPSK